MHLMLSGITEQNKYRVLERVEDVAIEFGLLVEEEIVVRHFPDPIAPPDDEPVSSEARVPSCVGGE